jgi:adenosylcobinamide-phosphate synthase
MTFLSILFALLIEQLRPLRADNPVYAGAKQLAVHMENWFNAGQEGHGRAAWFALMFALMMPTMVVYWLCAEVSPFLALAWNILIAYLTLGFRHYSHYFTSIQLALNSGNETSARALLTEWTGQDTAGMNVSEVSRLAVENALVTAHRNVFGVFFWFMVPIGPAGAIMYRVAEYVSRAWNEPGRKGSEGFGRFAATAFYWIDWIPARLTAIAFAIVGNFEDAIYAWRNLAPRWADESIGIILATGSGAMGLRLGTATENAADIPAADADAAAIEAAGAEPGGPVGEEATARALQSTVGLVWRALLLWMLLLLLLSFAVWFG